MDSYFRVYVIFGYGLQSLRCVQVQYLCFDADRDTFKVCSATKSELQISVVQIKPVVYIPVEPVERRGGLRRVEGQAEVRRWRRNEARLIGSAVWRQCHGPLINMSHTLLSVCLFVLLILLLLRFFSSLSERLLYGSINKYNFVVKCWQLFECIHNKALNEQNI